ncbi:MAG: hypothetical protein RL755_14 [Pseudomonadota bacterium]|jgi:hypothetical protein
MLKTTIPAYLYLQYRDDEALQSFVDSFNLLAQNYVDGFNALNLPIYNLQTNLMLDWVGNNLYSIPRPVFPFGHSDIRDAINTWAFNEIAFNERKIINPTYYAPTNDDVYRRVITWSHYRGDGYHFNIKWLKRRIMRFLTNTDVTQTYQISVTFGVGNQVNITIYNNNRHIIKPSAIINMFAFNEVAFNQLNTVYESLTKYELAETVKKAIEAGVLPLPFQFTYVINVI